MHMHKDNLTLEDRVLQLRVRMRQFKQNYPEIFSTASKPSSSPVTGATSTPTPKSISDRLNSFSVRNVHGVEQ